MTPSSTPLSTHSDASPEGSRRAGEARWGMLLAAAVVSLLAGAGDSLDDRYERIRNMTAVERAALQHNFERFKALPEADRAKYRTLDREVASKVEFQKLMESYVKWLPTLSPVQREELRATVDPNGKLELVRKYRDEQERQRTTPPAFLPGLFGARERIAPLLRLSPADFNAVMETIERQIPADKRRGLEPLPAPQRHLQTVEMMLQFYRQRDARFPDEKLSDQMISAIAAENVRQGLRKIMQPDRQRQALSMLVVQGLAAEWIQDLERRKPTDAELMAFLQAQKPEVQNRIANQDQRAQRMELLWMFLGQKDPELGKDLKKIHELMEHFRPDGPLDRRGPGARPRLGPGPDRPGGNPREPERRPGADGPNGRPPRSNEPPRNKEGE